MDDLAVTEWLRIPGRELSERFSRSSGPGGQRVNSTASRVELSFDIACSAVLPEKIRQRMLTRLAHQLAHGVLTVAASDHRSQHANRRAARQRMAAALRDAATPPPPKRRPTKPSRGAKERRLAEKKRRGGIKQNRRAPPPE